MSNTVPASRSRRRAAALLLGIPLLVAACGKPAQEVSTSESAIDALSAAADKSSDAESFRASMRMEFPDDVRRCIPPNGELGMAIGTDDPMVIVQMDQGNRRAVIEIVEDGERTPWYADGSRILVPGAALPDGWAGETVYVAIDTKRDEEIYNALHTSITPLEDNPQAESLTPNQFLDSLEEVATDVRTTGDDTIDGDRATRYRITIDEEGWKGLNDARETDDVEMIDTPPPAAIDAWVDGDGYVRRIRVEPPEGDLDDIDVPFPGLDLFLLATQVIEFDRYGEPVVLPTDVVDFGDLDIDDPLGDLEALTESDSVDDDWTPPEGCDDILGSASALFGECDELGTDPGDTGANLDDDTDTIVDESDLMACAAAMGLDPDCYGDAAESEAPLPEKCMDEPFFDEDFIDGGTTEGCLSVTEMNSTTSTSKDCSPDMVVCHDPADATTTTEDGCPGATLDDCTLMDVTIGVVSESCRASLTPECRALASEAAYNLDDEVLPDEEAFSPSPDSLSACLESVGVDPTCAQSFDASGAELSDPCGEDLLVQLTRDLTTTETEP